MCAAHFCALQWNCAGSASDQSDVNHVLINHLQCCREIFAWFGNCYYSVAIKKKKRKKKKEFLWNHYKCNGKFLKQDGKKRLPSSTQPTRKRSIRWNIKSRSHLAAFLTKHPYNTPGSRQHPGDEALESNSPIYHFSTTHLSGAFNQQDLLKKTERRPEWAEQDVAPPSPSVVGKKKACAELNTHLTISKIRGGADVCVTFSAVQLLVN